MDTVGTSRTVGTAPAGGPVDSPTARDALDARSTGVLVVANTA
ncbi:hypothetical protein [Micromonospora sp. 067-2]